MYATKELARQVAQDLVKASRDTRARTLRYVCAKLDTLAGAYRDDGAEREAQVMGEAVTAVLDIMTQEGLPLVPDEDEGFIPLWSGDAQLVGAD
jgi:hypothetical protein